MESSWGYSSVGRAPALQAGGHEFESRYLHVDNYESSRLRLADEFRKLVFVKAYDRM